MIMCHSLGPQPDLVPTADLKHKYCNLSTTTHFFFCRLVRLWNSLPSSLIDLSQYYSTVKINLINNFWNYFQDNFDSTNSCSVHILCPCSSCPTSTTPLYLIIILSHSTLMLELQLHQNRCKSVYYSCHSPHNVIQFSCHKL